MNKSIKKAIRIVGSQRKLAFICNVSQPAVCKWLKGKRISAEHVASIVNATGGQVTCEELRPDIDWSVLRK